VGDERHIAALIARQHGHVTRKQLLDCGVPARTIDHRIASGKLIRVYAGVYAVGYIRVEPVARAMAAVLACGEAAVLSHDSAAALWGLRPWPRIPEVTTREHRRHPGIKTHRSKTLEPNDLRIQLNVPTTSAGRAIADIAPRLSDRRLTRATQDARHEGHLKPTDLQKLLLRCPRLRALVDPQQNPTRSGLEDILIPWLRKHGLPIPILNTRVNGFEVDALFPEHHVILELDSWKYHKGHPQWLADRERDAHHLSFGYPTVRVTEDRLTDNEAQRLTRTLNVRH
jgi:hypothetical protein